MKPSLHIKMNYLHHEERRLVLNNIAQESGVRLVNSKHISLICLNEYNPDPKQA